jgi:hypothetical protein
MTSNSGYEPRDLRLGINHPVVLVRADGTEFSAVISDVSRGGFRLKSSEVPKAGERVIFRGKSGDVPGEVRWSYGNDAGGIFLQPGED